VRGEITDEELALVVTRKNGETSPARFAKFASTGTVASAYAGLHDGAGAVCGQMWRKASGPRWLIARLVTALFVVLLGTARADGNGGAGSQGGAPVAQSMPSPSLDWVLGRWRADADSETPQLEFVWTRSTAGLHGELAEIASDGARSRVATYDIAPEDGRWALTVREEPGVYRFSGERMGDEYIRFKWKSVPPERARRAFQAKRSKAGRGGLGPLVSSGSTVFLELKHLRGGAVVLSAKVRS
jgi:hypothetical protein